MTPILWQENTINDKKLLCQSILRGRPKSLPSILFAKFEFGAYSQREKIALLQFFSVYETDKKELI